MLLGIRPRTSGVELRRKGVMHLERLQNSFSFVSNWAGMFVMFASEGISWETMISSYDTRGWVEKAFDAYNADTDGSWSRIGDPDRARARFFIKTVALIMRVRIQNVLRDYEKEILSSREERQCLRIDVECDNEAVGTVDCHFQSWIFSSYAVVE